MISGAPREWVLGRGTGWPASERRGVVVEVDDGALTLGSLPGRADRIEWPKDSARMQPTAFSGDPSTGLLVLDGDAHAILHAVIERPNAARSPASSSA